jgi:3-dehydroquinate synthase
LGGFRRYKHGEAVAMGMVTAAEIGENLGLTASGSAAALRAVLAAYDLETRCPYARAALLPHMELDKKNSGGAVRLVLLRRIGEAFVRSFDAGALREVQAKGGVFL